MKLSYSFSVLAFALSASAAPAADLRCETGRNNVQAHLEYQPWIKQLFSPCVGGAAGDGSDFWGRKECVAAAIAMGPRALVNYAVCDKASIPVQNALANLDYAVYASIVGGCAYDPEACGITRQNLVDLVYSQLDAAHATIWPQSGDQLIADVVEPVFTWAGSDPTVKYTRFNQWLHESGYPDIISGDGHSGNGYFYDHESDN